MKNILNLITFIITIWWFIHNTYLLDQKLKPVGNKGISCTIRFFIPDSTTIDAVLKPYQEDGFVLESTTIVYQSCKVTFKLPGRSVSARFDNESMLVKKK